ncbi:MAG: hypothetical protein R8K53_01985 [Mariprofundaceae bacterium]
MKSRGKLSFLLPICILAACQASPDHSPPVKHEAPTVSVMQIPIGSYQKSCSSIAVQEDALSATCTKLNGKAQATSLNRLASCLNSIQEYGDIGNIDGHLICLPDLPKVVSGFTFPESETVLNQWVYSGDSASIYKHAWGIWAGLTHVVGQVDGANVRAFETWNTTTNISSQIDASANYKIDATANHRAIAPPHVKKLHLQLAPAKRFMRQKAPVETAATDSDTRIAVSVAYNPPAAQFTIRNKLFLQSTLNQYVKNGYTEIPDFPGNAITIKPVYKLISKDVANGIYTFPGWPGTPSPAKTFPEEDWNSCVYVDIKGTGSGGSSIDKGCTGRNAENTFNLNQFIYKMLSKEDVEYITQQFSLHEITKEIQAGDYAILVGMHVTSREMKRWAWQTFWWSADADVPYLPSSQKIAGYRPGVLDDAAKHYAMAAAYQMVSPAQPITKGQSVGSSLIAYNPHLEAGFDKGTFQIVRAIDDTEADKPIINEYGVQSNCMTCHNLAQYKPNVAKNYYTENQGANRQKPYGTDYYMSLDDNALDGALKLDFSWSILGNLKLDDNEGNSLGNAP